MLINSSLNIEQISINKHSAYLFHGPERCLLDDCMQQLHCALKQQGYKPDDTFFIEKETDWKKLNAHVQTQSLFHDKTIITCYVRLKSSSYKITHPLINYLAHSNHEQKLLLYWHDFTTTLKKNTSWIRCFQQNHVLMLNGQTLNHSQHYHWAQSYSQRLALTVAPNAIELILSQTNYNLYATKQVFDKLVNTSLCNKTIRTQQLQHLLTNENHFPIFSLTDTALRGNTMKALDILNQLKSEKTEPKLVLWYICKELRTLSQLAFAKYKTAAAYSLSQCYKNLKIHSSQKPLYEKLISLKTESYWHSGLRLAYQADKVITGQRTGDIWVYCQQLLLHLSHALAPYQATPMITGKQ